MKSEQLIDEFRGRVFRHITMSREDSHQMLKFVTQKTYPRKTFLLNVGDKWGRLFYVHRGLIRLFYTDRKGREFNKAFFWEGHCIWPVAPRDRNEEALFSIAALEDVTVSECSFQRIYDVLSKRGHWEKFALPFAESLVEQKFLREHDFLLLSARERFEEFSRAHPTIVPRIPDYHLASFLGITNVSLSRIKRSAYV